MTVLVFLTCSRVRLRVLPQVCVMVSKTYRNNAAERDVDQAEDASVHATGFGFAEEGALAVRAFHLERTPAWRLNRRFYTSSAFFISFSSHDFSPLFATSVGHSTFTIIKLHNVGDPLPSMRQSCAPALRTMQVDQLLQRHMPAVRLVCHSVYHNSPWRFTDLKI